MRGFESWCGSSGCRSKGCVRIAAGWSCRTTESEIESNQIGAVLPDGIERIVEIVQPAVDVRIVGFGRFFCRKTADDRWNLHLGKTAPGRIQIMFQAEQRTAHKQAQIDRRAEDRGGLPGEKLVAKEIARRGAVLHLADAVSDGSNDAGERERRRVGHLLRHSGSLGAAGDQLLASPTANQCVERAAPHGPIVLGGRRAAKELLSELLVDLPNQNFISRSEDLAERLPVEAIHLEHVTHDFTCKSSTGR